MKQYEIKYYAEAFNMVVLSTTKIKALNEIDLYKKFSRRYKNGAIIKIIKETKI